MWICAEDDNDFEYAFLSLQKKLDATTPQDSSAQNDETGVGATAKKTRKRVEPVRIDFNADPIDLTSLFATGRATINLPKNAVRNNNLLPEQDYQFSSEQMVSLFMRPKWKVRF